MSELFIPKNLKKIRKILQTPEQLKKFEADIKERYVNAEIKGVVHLSGGNEDELIEIFQYIDPKDWVFSSWRNHYHALLHGISEEELNRIIIDMRKSMSVHHRGPDFYASSIVGGATPIGIGVAEALKRSGNPENRKVWIFVGDMTAETGIFHEAYKYATNHNLPVHFVIEDNNQSTNTPTDEVWGKKTDWKEKENIIYYKYERIYPHHGCGVWISF
jgi:pyruvate dehydrogenase E1 component alpha subunit